MIMNFNKRTGKLLPRIYLNISTQIIDSVERAVWGYVRRSLTNKVSSKIETYLLDEFILNIFPDDLNIFSESIMLNEIHEYEY